MAMAWSAGVGRAQSSALLPQWQVGQEQVTGAALAPSPPPAAPEKLTMREAIETAFGHNLSFRQTMQDLLDSQSDLRAAEQRWALTVGTNLESVGDGGTSTGAVATAGFTWAALSGSEFSVQAARGALSRRDYEVAYTHPLGRGKGSVSDAYEAVRQARSSYRQSLLSFYLDQQDLAERVISAYAEAYKRDQLRAVEQRGLDLAKQALADAQARRAEEVNTIFDVTRAQFRVARAQQSLYQAQQSYGDAMDQLLRLLGLQIGGEPTLTTEPKYVPEPIDSEHAVTTALEQRAELPLLDLQIDDDRAVVAIARDARRPRIDAVTSLSRFRGGGDTEVLIGVQSSLPIRSRRLEENARIAQRSLMVSEQDRQDIRLRIAAEVRNYVRAAQAAADNVDSATQNLAAAQESMDAAQLLLEEGRGDNRNLIDAQDELTGSEALVFTAKIDYYLATVRLQQAMGMNVLGRLPEEAPAP
jgi:outer membrane protein TolC